MGRPIPTRRLMEKVSDRLVEELAVREVCDRLSSETNDEGIVLPQRIWDDVHGLVDAILFKLREEQEQEERVSKPTKW